MSRFALSGVLLCIVVIGQSDYSESTKSYTNWLEEDVTTSELFARKLETYISNIERERCTSKVKKEISKIDGLFARSFFERSRPSLTLEEQLKLIKNLALKDPRANKLASSLARLDTCDQEATGIARSASHLLVDCRKVIPKKVSRLEAILSDYISVCTERMVREVSELMADAPSSLNLESKLELIKRFATESKNEIAALLAKLKFGTCDRAGLKSVGEAIEIVRAYNRSPNMIDFMKDLRRQTVEVCFEEVNKDWTSIRDKLTSEELSNTALLTSTFGRYPYSKNLRKDIKILVKSRALANEAADAHYFGTRFAMAMVLDLKFAPDKYIISQLLKQTRKSCKALLKLEQIPGILLPFFWVVDTFKPDEIEGAIGELGSERSQMVEWAGRWRVCRWLLTLDNYIVLHRMLPNANAEELWMGDSISR